MDRHTIYNFATNAFEFNEKMPPSRNAAYLALCEADAYLKPDWATASAGELGGVRTSATVFTPTVSEAWDTDELADTYAVLYVDGTTDAFTFHEIASNIATAFTIKTTVYDAAILASADMYLLYATLAAAQAACDFVKV